MAILRVIYFSFISIFLKAIHKFRKGHVSISETVKFNKTSLKRRGLTELTPWTQRAETLACLGDQLTKVP